MDNNNNKNDWDKAFDEIFSKDTVDDGGYTYERERKSVNRSNAIRRERAKQNKTKKTVLMVSVIVLLAALWLVCAFAIVRGVFGTEEPTPDTPDTQEGIGGSGSGDISGSGGSGGGEGEQGVQFTTVSMGANDYKYGLLILINSSYKYDQKGDTMLKSQLVDAATYNNGTYIVVHSNVAVKLRSDTVKALNAMFSAFNSETGLSGYRMSDDYGYISAEDQQKWYDAYAKKHGSEVVRYEFKSGESEHEAGRTFDLKVSDDGVKYISQARDEYSWIYDNGYKYGVIDRYPTDKKDKTGVDMLEGKTLHCDHFRYVGVAAATAMHDNNWCFEEFHENIKYYTYDGEHLKVEASDGTKYEMYYYPASSGSATDVKVPDGLTYDISGDNMGGYIVTVTMGK